MLRAKAVEAYETKEKEVTPEILRVVEQRYLLLPIIDRQWVDHLYVMDHLKTGIGLRGYGQKDPRVEYEKEAFEIFESLKNNIADEAIKGVFRVVIEHGPPQQELMPYRERAAVRADSVGRTRSATRRQRGRVPAQRVEQLLGPMPGTGRSVATVPHEQRRRRTGKAGTSRPTKSRTKRTMPLRQRQEIQTLPWYRRVTGGAIQSKTDPPPLG